MSVRFFIVFMLAAMVLMPLCAFADTITLEYTFEKPSVYLKPDGTSAIYMPGLHKHQVPGQPVIPSKTIFVLLPHGHKAADILVTAKMPVLIAENVILEHGARFAALAVNPSNPSPSIYNSDAPFPKTVIRPLSVQHKHGAAILPITIYPVSFHPKAEVIQFYPHITITVMTGPNREHHDQFVGFRGLKTDLRQIERLVENPGALDSYPNKNTEQTVDYLVIANNEMAPYLSAFIEHKRNMFGITTQVSILEDIYESFPGADQPEQIRNRIKEAYRNGARWVLLAGDADGPSSQVLPTRGLYVTGIDPDLDQRFTDENMASDIYYGCLDGSFNEDGDEHWGEVNDGPGGGDVDLLFDIHVGRIPADNPAELKTQLNKIMDFESGQAPNKALFVGEMADEYTWGGDNKDEVYKYTNQVPVTRLYDRDGTFGHDQVLWEINSDQYQWLNHLGHSNVYYMMTFTPDEIHRLSNDTYFLGYSQGCYAGSVDGWLASDEWSGMDSMAEYFTVKTNHGAFAYIANTRYGFYLQGRTDGPSNIYDWEFAKAVFQDRIRSVGNALDTAREQCIGLMNDGNMIRWAGYTIMLFGDPHTPLKFICDADQDGALAPDCGGDDCNDAESKVNPSLDEDCSDGIDNNCDGLTDDEDLVCQSMNDDDDSADDDDISDDDSDDDDDSLFHTDDDADGGKSCTF